MKIVIGLLFLLLLVPVATFIPVGDEDTKHDVEIYLISNAIHIGIVLPVKNKIIDWRKFVGEEYFSNQVLEMEWIEFGWGDRRFYFEMPTWDHFTLSLAADALLLPDSAVMHVSYLPTHPTKYSNVIKVSISYETYEKMVKSIRSWFVLENEKPILIPEKGYSGEDNFFEAKGSYSLIRTCNVWTSDIFAASGLRHPLWSPTKHGLEFIWRKE